MSNPTISKIKHIVLSGGGAAGFAFYGALKNTHSRGLWNIGDIERIYSTSAGSFISVFISLGYEWKDIDDYIIKRPWNQVYKFELPMAIQAIQKQGIFTKNVILETFTPLFNGKDIPLDITLDAFYEINKKELHFITTNYDLFEYVDISYKTHPKWLLIDAVYASCCLPILFCPLYKENEDNTISVFMDGGIRMNYPLLVCLNDGCDPSEVMGIRRVDKVESSTLLQSYSLFDVLFKLFNQYLRKVEMPSPSEKIQHQIDIPFSSVDLIAIFKCLSSEEERSRLIEFGIECSKT
jgi:predicted acylesterase/phospholipase RssA